MKRRFLTEILLTPEQQNKFFKTINACRYVYNMYLSYNKKIYAESKSFINANDFSVWLNNEYIPKNPNEIWIKNSYSKAIKKSIQNAYASYIRFFKGLSGFPRYKKKGVNEPKMYFVQNHDSDCICERHRIKIPYLSWVKIKEKGYIPTTKNGYTVTSGTIAYLVGKFYISAVVEIPEKNEEKNINDGIGIDLGIKNLAILSNGIKYDNINKTTKIKKLKKKIKREQRKLSRKFEFKKKGKSTQTKNIQKQQKKLKKAYHQLSDIRKNYIKAVINNIIKSKPAFITIENLNVKGMMKNRHLSKAIQEQNFSYFKKMLIDKCHENNIELRIADRFYPSSKNCYNCGKTKNNLKLSDRIFKCDFCNYENDRDLNAALNLKKLKNYTLI